VDDRVIINHVQDNRVIVNDRSQGRRKRDQSPERKTEDDKPSGLQVLAAAGIVTTTAIGVSYIWHSAEHLNEMRRLQADCKVELGRIKDAAYSQDTAEIWRASTVLYEKTIELLDMLIHSASVSQKSKLASVASFGLTATGSVLYTGFLTSTLGLAGLFIGCSGIVVMANNYFATNSKKSQRNKLVKSIEKQLLEIESLEARVNARYPEYAEPMPAYAGNVGQPMPAYAGPGLAYKPATAPSEHE
jgi:hypothetical protein